MNGFKKLTALTLGIMLAASSVVNCSAVMSIPEKDDVGMSRIAGDVDGDGTVTSSDALTVLRMSVSGKDAGVENLPFYIDVDGDGQITANDALLILRESVFGGVLPIENATDSDFSDNDNTDVNTSTDNTDDDTSTDIIDTENTDADTSTDIIDTENTDADTSTDIIDTENTDADTSTDIIDTENTDADTSTDIIDTENTDADTSTDNTDTDDTEYNYLSDVDLVIDDSDHINYYDTDDPEGYSDTDYMYDTDDTDDTDDIDERFVTKDTDLYDEITPAATPENASQAITLFAPKLVKETYTKDKNYLVSPLSLYAALSMLVNGADGNTRDEILSMLNCSGDIDVDALNKFFNEYMKELEKSEYLDMANTIFVAEKPYISLVQEFADEMDNDYDAEIFYATPDEAVVERLNKWASDHTDGQIKKILEKGDITEETVAMLINAINFNGLWKDPYEDYQIEKRTFRNADGSETETDFLRDVMWGNYYYDGKSVAFEREYEGGYSFIAILPNEDVGVDGYIERMTDNTLPNLLENCGHYGLVTSYIPKFEFDNKYVLNDALKNMGMIDAFDGADANFKLLMNTMLSFVNIYVDKVTQLTHVALDEKGTKAAAVTIIEMKETTDAPEPPEEDVDKITIDLNRPFVFVIYDKKQELPLFVGAVNELK